MSLPKEGDTVALKDMKLCIDCKHARAHRTGFRGIKYGLVCVQGPVKTFDLVQGHHEYPSCEESRAGTGRCGQSAIYFSPRYIMLDSPSPEPKSLKERILSWFK